MARVNLSRPSSISRISTSALSATILLSDEILQLHVVAAELDQHLVELRLAFDVFLALLALDLEERRLRDVDEALLHQLRHLAEEEGQQQRADVRAVDVRIGHDDDLVVASAARC